MKHLSAVEVMYLAAELQCLVGARLSQVYQPAPKELLLQFHVAGRGRAMLKVRVPHCAYVASVKEPAVAVTGFCSLLRRRLGNATLRSVSQAGFERILQLDFSSKGLLFSLFFELFSKGSIILVHGGKILAAEQKQAWSTRTIATGQPYKLPPASSDPRLLDDRQLLQMLKSTDKTDLVRFLAIELGLGGTYAEELCSLSEIDKKMPPSEVTAAFSNVLIQSLKKLLDSKPSPSVIYDDCIAVDAVPIILGRYKGCEQKTFANYSEALEFLDSSAAASKPSRYAAEISRLKTIINRQEEAMADARGVIQKNSRSGELLYGQYHDIRPLMEAVNAARKRGGWEAVKELQKSSKRLKSVDEKNGRVVVDVQ